MHRNATINLEPRQMPYEAGNTPILSLPDELIEIIMNQLITEIKTPLVAEDEEIRAYLPVSRPQKPEVFNLVSLILSHPTFYRIGLFTYKKIVTSSLPLYSYLGLTKPQDKSKSAPYDIFRLNPSLASSVDSIIISDYVKDDPLTEGQFNTTNSYFLWNLEKQLGAFKNLTSISIEMGNNRYSTLLIDFLIFLPLPTGLKSLSIMMNPMLFSEGKSQLSLYKNRIVELNLTESLGLYNNSNEFRDLQHLMIGFMYTDSGEDFTEFKAIHNNVLKGGSLIENATGFYYLVIMLRHLVFKHGPLSLKHLVLENISPYLIFDPKEVFSHLEILKPFQNQNEFENGDYYPDDIHPKSELWFDPEFDGIYEVNDDIWVFADWYDHGLPELVILEINNPKQKCFSRIAERKWHKDYAEINLFDLEEMEIHIYDEDYKSSDQDWIAGYLRQESIHGWKLYNEDLRKAWETEEGDLIKSNREYSSKPMNDWGRWRSDKRSLIVFNRQFALDCEAVYSLNCDLFQKEEMIRHDRFTSWKRMIPGILNREEFIINIDRINPSRWRSICQNNGLENY